MFLHPKISYVYIYVYVKIEGQKENYPAFKAVQVGLPGILGTEIIKKITV